MKTVIAILGAVVFAVGFSICPTLVSAEDQPAKESAKPSSGETPTPENIQNWIRALDSNSFTERQSAARKLAECGKEADEALGKAATGDSLEVTRQAIDILRRHHQSNDPAAKESAAAALKKLAASDNKSAASRAAEILKPPAAIADQPKANGPGFQPAIPLGGIGGGIQIVPLPAGGIVRRIQVQAQNNNGAKSIEVDENGKKVKIDEDQNGIKITTTENVNGQEKSETTEAKDLDELKKKNPEAAKAYEKYAGNAGAGNVVIGGGNGGAIQIQINGQAIPLPNIQPVPVPVPVPNGLPGNVIPAIPLVPAVPVPLPNAKLRPNPNNPKQARELLDSAKQHLEKALEQVKTNPDGALEAIRSAKSAIEDAQSKLQGAGRGPIIIGPKAFNLEAPGGDNAAEEAAKRTGEELRKALEETAKALENAAK